jgi:BolA protein
MDRIAEIRLRLQHALQPLTLEIQDDSAQHRGHAGAAGGGGHYTVRVVSAQFAGLPLIARHRLVYQAVSDLMPGVIHALSIKAQAPEEQ